MKGYRKENGFIELERESFKEYFVIGVAEGALIPRFYLPIKHNIITNTVSCWILPLAPLAWISYVLYNILSIIYCSCTEWLGLLQGHLSKMKYFRQKREQENKNKFISDLDTLLDSYYYITKTKVEDLNCIKFREWLISTNKKIKGDIK